MVGSRNGGSSPPFRQPNVEKSRNPTNVDGWLGFAAVALVILGIGGLSQCSNRNTASNSAAFVDGNVSNGIAAQAPPPPQPLNAAAVNRGVSHLRLAVNAEGFSGAMVYSQNCYDALAHRFTWAKLDTCGTFDMLAVRSLGEVDTSSLANEAGYFQSEAAAGRYISAATAAGQPADEVDTRLSDLQARVSRVSLAGQRTSSTSEKALNQVEPSRTTAPNRGDALSRCVRGALGRLPPNIDRTMLCTCAIEKMSVNNLEQGEAINQCATEVEEQFPAR